MAVSYAETRVRVGDAERETQTEQPTPYDLIHFNLIFCTTCELRAMFSQF